MEFVGSFMIMSVMLGLFFAAIWLCMPFMILGLSRRVNETLATLLRLESRLARLEQQLKITPENNEETKRLEE